jgi:zeaxanthin epoxidase
LWLPAVATAFAGFSNTLPRRNDGLFTSSSTTLLSSAAVAPPVTMESTDTYQDEIDDEHPLRVLIAGAGVGGLALAKVLSKDPRMRVTVLEQTSEFRRFGGPIQLASNAMHLIREMDGDVYSKIAEKFTVTGDKVNGIKDGIRTEWYAKFDLARPAESRKMPYTGVIGRADLQEIYLDSLPEGTVRNGDGVESYEHSPTGGVKVVLQSGKEVEGDVLIGADGIWSAVRATMRGEPRKGEGSGTTYSGYTVFAGELAYDSPDYGEVGYKVYIGPKQYFVITDIGNGNYQWYAFLARPPGSAEMEEKPEGSSKYLQDLFDGWSDEIHHILKATQEHEIEQRDLYDRPPSAMKPWTDGPVALLGDGVHVSIFSRSRSIVIDICCRGRSMLSLYSLSSGYDAQSRTGWLSSGRRCICYCPGTYCCLKKIACGRKIEALPTTSTSAISGCPGTLAVRFRHHYSWI